MTSTGSDDLTGRLAGYYPAWLDNLADDVSLEGSMMDGFVQGAEAVRAVIASIRTRYDYQDFHAVGPFGDKPGSRIAPPGSAASRSRTSPWSPATPPADAARRGQLQAPQHSAGLVPAAGREVRRHPRRRALPDQRFLTGPRVCQDRESGRRGDPAVHDPRGSRHTAWPSRR